MSDDRFAVSPCTEGVWLWVVLFIGLRNIAIVRVDKMSGIDVCILVLPSPHRVRWENLAHNSLLVLERKAKHPYPARGKELVVSSSIAIL